MMLTLVAWPRWWLSGVYTVRLLLPLFPYWTLWIQTTKCSPYLRLQSSYINYLEIFCTGDLSLLSRSFIHSFSHILISVWTHTYSLGCNSMLAYFIARTGSGLAIESSFSRLLCPFLCFLNTNSFFFLNEGQTSIYIFLIWTDYV